MGQQNSSAEEKNLLRSWGFFLCAVNIFSAHRKNISDALEKTATSVFQGCAKASFMYQP